MSYSHDDNLKEVRANSTEQPAGKLSNLSMSFHCVMVEKLSTWSSIDEILDFSFQLQLVNYLL